MKIRFSVLLLLLPLLAASSRVAQAGMKYRGGMFLHSGYLTTERMEKEISGACFGIGGQLTFTPGNHFRLGPEGYTSYFNYPGKEGSFKLGWGGLLAGYQFGDRKIHPVLSLTLGGGKVNDMQFVEVNTDDQEIDRIIYRKYPVMLASPALSAEYALQSKLILVMKLDYLILLSGRDDSGFASGPRLYLGILFNRQ